MGQRLGNAPRNLVWPHSQPCFEQRFGLETSQGQSLQSALAFLIWGSFCFPVTSLKPEPQRFIHKKNTGVYIISLYPHHATTFLTQLFLGSQATTEFLEFPGLTENAKRKYTISSILTSLPFYFLDCPLLRQGAQELQIYSLWTPQYFIKLYVFRPPGFIL